MECAIIMRQDLTICSNQLLHQKEKKEKKGQNELMTWFFLHSDIHAALREGLLEWEQYGSTNFPPFSLSSLFFPIFRRQFQLFSSNRTNLQFAPQSRKELGRKSKTPRNCCCNSSSLKISFPTKHFAILEPQNPWTEVSYSTFVGFNIALCQVLLLFFLFL